MERLWIAFVFFVQACAEPTLIGKLCTEDRPCPDDLVCSREGVCVVEIQPTEALVLTLEGPGRGIVTSSPAGLRCEEDCAIEFDTGLTVTLTPHALPASGFAGWKGPCRGRGDCTVRMDSVREVVAVFGIEAGDPWLVRFGGTADDRITSVTADLQGRALVAGHFGTDVRFESTPKTSSGGLDGFVAAIAPTADLAFIETYGGAGDDAPLAVACDLENRTYAGGWYYGPAMLFGESAPGLGDADPLVARLDGKGAREALFDLGSESTDVAQDILADGEGGVFVVGWVAGPLRVGGVTHGFVGATDGYLVHFGPTGSADVVEVYGSDLEDKVLSIDAAPDGDGIAIAGVFQGTISLGGDPLTSTAAHALFVAVMGKDGSHVWSKAFDAGGSEPAVAVRFDAAGDLLISGGYADMLDLGGAMPSAGGLDAFAAKLDREGRVVWAKRFGGPGDESFFELAVDRSGNALVGGGFNGTVMFGDPLTSAGSWDAVAAKLSPSGDVIWARRIGGSELDVILGVAFDLGGKAIVGGHFGGTVDFGSTVLSSAGSQDAFILSLGR